MSVDNPALLQAKLRALAADGFGVHDLEPSVLTGAAAGVAGTTGYFLANQDPDRAVGQALAWSVRRDLRALEIIAVPGGVAARRATHFRGAVRVWENDGRTLRPAETAPWPAPIEITAEQRRLADDLHDAGLDVVVEHGDVTGEVAGLEVARVVVDGTGTRIEVGVGRHDRDAFAQLHGELVTAEALALAATSARAHRSAESDGSHPLTRLAPERWLRDLVCRAPELVGAETLQPVALAVRRGSVKDRVPAAAAGVDHRGRAVVVVTSVGVDLDLVPVAAETRAYLEQTARAVDPRLVLVLPERDALAVTRDVIHRLERPAELVTVPDRWRSVSLRASAS